MGLSPTAPTAWQPAQAWVTNCWPRKAACSVVSGLGSTDWNSGCGLAQAAQLSARAAARRCMNIVRLQGRSHWVLAKGGVLILIKARDARSRLSLPIDGDRHDLR